MLLGARNIPLRSITAYLASIPPGMVFGRPVVDQTGLDGMYDFSLNWLPDRSGSAAGAGEPLDAQGPTFEEALRDQLGLKPPGGLVVGRLAAVLLRLEEYPIPSKT